MEWNNNPRIDIERRIKQLEARVKFLLPFRSLGSISYESGIAARFYPSIRPRKQFDKAGRLLKATHKELNLKRKQLKSF